MNIYSELWKGRFLRLAREVSTWSKDPSTKTGAVVVNEEGGIVSTGYNGLPMGVSDLPARNNRPEKYYWYEHAERNAIFLAKRCLDGHIIYCTHHPCADCARAIIQSGISTVVIDTTNTTHGDGSMFNTDLSKTFSVAEEMFKEACVEVIVH